MRKIDSCFEGTEIAFFPIGRGYLGDSFPDEGVMIVGSEFGTEQNVLDVLRAGSERLSDPTWRRLLAKLDRAGIDRASCWFTNFALCCRAGAGSNSEKPSPWRGNREFIETYARLFALQIELQRPRALLVLGGPTAEALAIAFPASFSSWHSERFAHRDEADGALITNAMFGSILVRHVVSLVHPSKGQLNEKFRRFRGQVGAEAENALLKIVASP